MSRFLQKLVFLGISLLLLSGVLRLSLTCPADYHFTSSAATLQKPGYNLYSCVLAGSYLLNPLNQGEDNFSIGSGTALFILNGLRITRQTEFLLYSQQEKFQLNSLYLLFRKLRL